MIKIRVGDIFTIKIRHQVCLGQVVNVENEILYIISFKNLFDIDHIDISSVIFTTPIFACLTFDAKFYSKEWNIISNNASNLINIKTPVYKIWSKGKLFAISYDRSISVEIDDDLDKQLIYRKTITPQIFVDAIEAYHSQDPWDNYYDNFLYKYVIDSNKYLR